jgi:transposase
MLKTKITLEEKTLLRQHAKQSPLILVRNKANAVLLWDNNVDDATIADMVGRAERTVAKWRRAWNAQRIASLFTGHQNNDNAAKLTREQKEQIRQVLQQPPSDYGLPGAFWDVPRLKQYVSAEFNAVYESGKSYHFLLKYSDLSFKYPDVFDRRRNEQLIKERMKVIKQDVDVLLRRDDWEVFAVDEVKMQQESVIRRAWLKKGKKTVIKVNRKKESQSYIGYLNQKTFICHLYGMADKQNSTTVLAATRQFLELYPDKHIAIIWDNAAFHKSKQIREQLRRGGLMERVHLIPMPPYAPDENPIEKVWNTAKTKIANIQHDTFTETKQAFGDYVASRPFAYSF